MGFLTWLQETDFAQFLASDPYAYPVLLCFHAIGMAAVVGLVWVMSARVLGYPKGMSVEVFEQLSTIALWGFAINTLSGLLIFSTEATRVIVNLDFQLKMACILFGGFAVWLMLRTVRKTAPEAPINFPLAVKIIAGLASASWLLAIIFGRQIAYTLKPPF
ncbi:MAG TPA: hypothetical protein VFV70_13300 [Hyphomonadaceae bacterium]|nr:hypothetical protein [Hyphomonadaceae bacterium]